MILRCAPFVFAAQLREQWAMSSTMLRGMNGSAPLARPLALELLRFAGHSHCSPVFRPRPPFAGNPLPFQPVATPAHVGAIAALPSVLQIVVGHVPAAPNTTGALDRGKSFLGMFQLAFHPGRPFGAYEPERRRHNVERRRVRVAPCPAVATEAASQPVPTRGLVGEVRRLSGLEGFHRALDEAAAAVAVDLARLRLRCGFCRGSLGVPCVLNPAKAIALHCSRNSTSHAPRPSVRPFARAAY